jgi:protein O-GlcNAc transferase
MRWDESIQCFARSLEIKPRDPEVLKNYGVALSRMHQWDEAVPYFLKAIEYHPGDYVEAIEQLASACSTAIATTKPGPVSTNCGKTTTATPPSCRNSFPPASRDATGTNWKPGCSRSGVEQGLSALTDNPFVTLSFPGVSAEEQRRVAENFARHSIPASVLDAPEHRLSVSRERGPGSRLRIGYLSADYRNHPVGQIMPQVIELHDRSKVEVFGYSIGIDDQSEIRKRLSAAFDHFVDLRDCSVIETAQRIRADEIDILVDLNGWTADGRLEALALRGAPVQVTWLGYAGTTGHPKLADYLLGDPVVTPLQHAHALHRDARPSAELLSAGGHLDRPGSAAVTARRRVAGRGLCFLLVQQQLQVQPAGLRPLVPAPVGHGGELPVVEPAGRWAQDRLRKEIRRFAASTRRG